METDVSVDFNHVAEELRWQPVSVETKKNNCLSPLSEGFSMVMLQQRTRANTSFVCFGE